MTVVENLLENTTNTYYGEEIKSVISRYRKVTEAFQ